MKNNIKMLKGLNVDEHFVFVNVHICDFCKREFSKPCALGGHISKVHRGKGVKMDEENFESLIPRGKWDRKAGQRANPQISERNDVHVCLIYKNEFRKNLIGCYKDENVRCENVKSWVRDQCLIDSSWIGPNAGFNVLIWYYYKLGYYFNFI